VNICMLGEEFVHVCIVHKGGVNNFIGAVFDTRLQG